METPNRGTGAGGANTNLHGKTFEVNTDNEAFLLLNGFERSAIKGKSKAKFNYKLSKTFEDKTIVYLSQGGLKTYFLEKYNIELCRNPDEAYVIEYNSGKKVLKILEKKEQRVEGSVETKLWSAVMFKEEYEFFLGEDFSVEYSYCVSDFLANKFEIPDKKFKYLKSAFTKHNINLFYGDNEDYTEKLNKWVFDE